MFDSFAEVFQIFLPLLLLAAITYKMRDEISLAWLGFARWWIPLSMFLILIAPSDKGDWMFPHDKGRVSFFASLLFFFVSLVIVASKYFSLKGGKRR